MSSQEPIDLVIILRIIEYMNRRADGTTGPDQVDGAAILNIVNHLKPGSSLGVMLQNETHNRQEISMGDRYYVDGQAAAVGREAKAENNTLNQIKASSPSDLSALAQELQALRAAMREQAATPEEDIAVTEVAKAMVAAQR